MWEILIILLGLPVGYLIAYLCKDELVDGRIWFKLIIVLSFVFGIVYYAKGEVYITWTLAFVSLVCLVSIYKSYEKKWTKVRKA